MDKQLQQDMQETEELALKENNTSVEEVAETSQESVSVPPPGSQLMALRQAKHFSIEDVANSLKLAPRQVAAIENDDYKALPGMVIVRGFIRSYAKLLGVDSAPLLAGLPHEKLPLQDTMPSPKVDSTPFEMNWPLKRHSLMPKMFTSLLIIVLIGAAAVYVLNKTGQLSEESFSGILNNEEQSESSQPAVEEDVAPAPVSTESSATTSVANTLLDTVNAQRTAIPSVNNTADAAASINAPVSNDAPTQEVPVAPAPTAVPVNNSVTPVTTETNDTDLPILNVANSKNVLRLSFNADAWVELRRISNDSVAFSRLLTKGASESFDINEPMQLVVGNASEVAATLRGQSLTLGVSKNNVARLNVK